MFAELEAAYSPTSESQIVDRNAQLIAALTGSMAGLKPLRRRIEAALARCDLFVSIGTSGSVYPAAGFVAVPNAGLGVRADGTRGPLLSVERAYAPLLQVRGQNVEAALSFSPRLLLAPQQTRPCLLGSMPAEVGPSNVPVEGLPPEEAVSHERVGKLGEECLVVGELRQGPIPGVYELRGRQGGPALVILGNSGESTGTQLSRRAWRLFAAAGGLTIAAAWMFAS